MKPAKRFGAEVVRDAAPYAYVNARWMQASGAWDRVLVTAPYDTAAVVKVLDSVSGRLQALLSWIGATGIDVNIAPFRAAPTYWIEHAANSGPAALRGCRPCGADVIAADVFGVRQADWSASLDARMVPFLLDLHGALAATFAPWRPL